MLKNLKSASKKDDGAALALVLIMIVLIGLWLTTVSFLTQSSSAAITQNIRNTDSRATAMDMAFESALTCLTSGSSSNCTTSVTIPQLGSASNSCDGKIKPVAVNNVFQALGTASGTTNRRTQTNLNGSVAIECTQPTGALEASGATDPLASYMLVGGDSTCTPATCITGINGGLNVVSYGCNPLYLNGGILNTSGAWNGVSGGSCNDGTSSGHTSMRLKTINSVVTVPDTTLSSNDSCAGLKFNVTSCDCPSGLTSATQCSKNLSADTLSPTSSSSYVNGYLNYVGTKLDAYPISTAAITSCSITPGYIDTTLLTTLNQKTNSGGGCSSFIFTSGIYGFSNAGTWTIDGGVSVSGSGVEIMLQGNSTIWVSNGSLTLSPRTSTQVQNQGAFVSQPVIAAGDMSHGSSFQYSNTSSPVILVGALGSLTTTGLIYAPNGYADLYQNTSGGAKLSAGAVFSGLTLRQAGASDSSSPPPSKYNGDRVVQLRFKYYLTRNTSNLCYLGACYAASPTSGLDFGIIQLRIFDYFGLANGSGYKVLAWRTPW